MNSMAIRGPMILCVCVVAAALSGCAATRSTFDIAVPRDPGSGTAGLVRITEVNDARRFEPSPRDPSVPSLENVAELNDKSIRSRAIARKRGGFGKAMADILLPEGRTVEQIVREAVTAALSESGYKVVDATSAEGSNAIPLAIDIRQFWSWFTPGAFSVSMEFEGILAMKSSALFRSDQETVRGYSIVRGMVATDGEWQRTIQEGVRDLIEKIKIAIRKPAAAEHGLGTVARAERHMF